MSKNLEVKVSSRKTSSGEAYEGTVSISGVRPTKLVRRADGATQFATKSAVMTSARTLAKQLGFASAVEVTLKRAAKRANRTSTPTTPPTNS